MTWTAEQLDALERLRADYEPSNQESGLDGVDAALPPAPSWPAGITPPAVDAYCAAQALAIAVPPEMVFVPLLVFAGATIGNAAELLLKPGWAVLPALWAALIADPGRKKTPSLRAAQWPLNVLQKRKYDRWQADMAQFEADMQAWEAAPKGERGERPQPPALDHLYTTDVTVEALVPMLSRLPGVAIVIDELSGFIASFDRYRGGKGGDRQQYLSLWAGAPVKVDRKSGGPIYATHPVAGVYGGIQPDFAGDLHNRNGQRDGMVERFLLFRPDVRRSGWTDDAVDPALLDPVVELFEALRSITPPDDAERITVQMHPDARRRFIAWYDENDAATEDATGLRAGFYSKLDGQLARVALVLHCLWNPDEPGVLLSDSTMQAAIAVVEFFRAHLELVLPLIVESSNAAPVGLSTRILSYLRRQDLRDAEGWVSRSDLYRRLGNVAAQDLKDALAELRDRGAVESTMKPTDTKPAELWRIVSADSIRIPTTPKIRDGDEPDSFTEVL